MQEDNINSMKKRDSLNGTDSAASQSSYTVPSYMTLIQKKGGGFEGVEIECKLDAQSYEYYRIKVEEAAPENKECILLEDRC